MPYGRMAGRSLPKCRHHMDSRLWVSIYAGLIHKDTYSDYGVSFPDLTGLHCSRARGRGGQGNGCRSPFPSTWRLLTTHRDDKIPAAQLSRHRARAS